MSKVQRHTSRDVPGLLAGNVNDISECLTKRRSILEEDEELQLVSKSGDGRAQPHA
ncbi:MAG: hypothetical protein ACKVII_26795 [Planctomycetales bacterium]